MNQEERTVTVRISPMLVTRFLEWKAARLAYTPEEGTFIEDVRAETLRQIPTFKWGLDDELEAGNFISGYQLAKSEGIEPIETAPKDRTLVLLSCKVANIATWQAGFFDGVDWLLSWGNDIVEPTHWMPLPPSPITPPTEEAS